MKRSQTLVQRAILSCVVWAAASQCVAAGSEPDSHVRPLVEKYCMGCHAGKKPKAGINLATFGGEPSVQDDADFALKVVDVLTDRSMPPKGKPGPTEDERQAASLAIKTILDASAKIHDPGPALIQRLTREQYDHTIRDLLGVDTHPADAFPTDGGGGAGFDNNASTLFLPPILLEKYLAAATEVLENADPERYLIARPSEQRTAAESARLCLASFSAKAFRRPVENDEIERLTELFHQYQSRGSNFEEAVKRTLRAVLVSPSFLFLVERDQEATEPVAIGDYELASRLSYFLWSSLPDDELFALAKAGELHRDEILEQQTKRMLADPKAKAFAKNFAGQWLRVSTLPTSIEPDRSLFPDYNPDLRNAMIEEPIALFHALLVENGSLLDLIDCKYTYLNEILAKHYGIEGVSGKEFRRVALSDENRGGLLGMASVLTLTSYPRRTSPVLRGKWVLEELLGAPPPPPPPEVKVLPEDDKPRKGLTFRQSLEKHRQEASCASCHAKMDPLGFGLENFDSVGKWRDKIADQPVDSSGELAGGIKFQGPRELKQILLDSKKSDMFIQNIVRRLLSYAIRRGSAHYDSATVNAIVGKLKENGCKSQELIAEVVKSYPFRYRRGSSEVGVKP